MDVDAEIQRDNIVDDQRALRLNLNQSPDQTDGLKFPIQNGPFSNPLMSKVLEKFGKMAFARSSACMEFEHFVRSLGVSGQTCLEIGTYQGITAILLSRFFEKVVCVSIDDDPRRIIKHDIVNYLGIKNIEFKDAKNNDEKWFFVKKLDFDFAYVDGDHVNGAVADFNLVKRCGRVLFHEYWPLQPAVWNLVNGLPKNEVKVAQFDCLAYWEQDGRRG